MKRKQLGILNALVTYAAEHIPGGLSEDETEVAQIVGGWAIRGRPVDPRVVRMFERSAEMVREGDMSDGHVLIAELRKELEETEEPISKIKYAPAFVGYDVDSDEKIVIYRNVDSEDELHIKRADGVLRALGPDWKIDTWFDDVRSTFHMRVKSPQWTGYAIGNRAALINEEGIRLWEPA